MRPALQGISLALIVLFTSGAALAQQGKDSRVATEVRHEADGTLKSLSFSASAGWRPEQAQELFERYYGVTPGGDIQLRLLNTNTTKMSSTTDRYTEFYKGLKVVYSSITVNSKDGKVSFMTSNFYKPATSLLTVAAITESEAFTRALGFVGATKYKWQNPIEEQFIKQQYNKPDTTYLPKGNLVWVEDIWTGNRDHKLHLAYSFDIYADEPMSRQEVFIDANTGRVLFANNLIKHTAATGASRYSGVVPFQTARVSGTYRLYDSTRGSGVYTRNMNNGTSYGAATQFTSATNTWPSPAPTDNVALDAHWGGEIIYDYWWTQQGRLSWDGLDGQLLQYVHYSNNYNNAYWNGVSMTYGDGTGIAAGGFSPLTSLDVTAHEVGHGVCEATCNLIYEAESGALNEAFSDCWGVVIEHWADPHETDAMPKAHWEMGEEIGTEPLRSINNPILQGQPDTYGGTNWFNVVGCTPSSGNDNCGVHRNSGLMNYWFFLLVNGGTGTNDNGDAYIVNSLGWTSSALILYQTELALTSTSEYMDARIASINAANMMFGPCSFEAQCVTSAWYAVGVGPNFVPCTPQFAFITEKMNVMETAPTTVCGASKTVTIGIAPSGPTIAGGSPEVTVVVDPSSTAVAGVDYTLSPATLIWTPGDMTTHNVTMTVFDNGNVNDDKTLKLAFTVNPMGSGATIAPFYDSLSINIYNDDSVPHVGATIYPNLNTGGIPVVSNFTSPFYGTNRRARSQYLIYAHELAEAGVVPRVPITQMAFNVITKNSTAAFLNFTISMRNTNVTDLYSAFVTTGLTQVYTGNHTTNLGIDSINFNTGTFTWDGTSNVVVQFCYGQNAATFTGNDHVSGVQQGEFTIGDYSVSNGGSGTGCSLGFDGNNRAVVRPAMRFKQIVPPTSPEPTAGTSRVWNVRSGEEVYFYSTTDTQTIAGIQGMDFDLGCVTATVTQAGNGLTPATFSGVNRMRKEINIVPTTNGTITNSTVTFYLNSTELAAVVPSTLLLLRTTAATDAAVNTSNSVYVTPTLVTGGNYTGFRGNFTGYGRYILIDGPLCNKPPSLITPGGPTSFCLGGNVLLSAPTGGSWNYQWQLGGTPIAGATNSSYTATLGGNYTVVVNQTTCDSVSPVVTVILDSAYAAPLTGTASVCIGLTTTLASTSTGGVWSTSDGSIATVTGGVVTGMGAGTANITYTVTNACGTDFEFRTVTVNAPTALGPITGTLAICNGGTSLLSNSVSGGVWSSGTTSVATISSSGNVAALTTGTSIITYTYTNAATCVSSVTATVTVNPVPSATTTPAGTFMICSGTTTTLNASPSTGVTYQWTNGGIDIPGATNASYGANAAGTYQVRVTNAFSCSSTSAIVDISINPTPTVAADVTLASSAGTVMCAPSSPVAFTATPVNGGLTPTYQWYVNGVAVGTSTPIHSYIPANGDVVTVELTSSYVCASPATATASLTLTVNPVVTPSAIITPTPNDTVCIGGTVTYNATPVFGGSAPTYIWTRNGVNVATGPSYSHTPVDGDIIICYITSDYPCATSPTGASAPFTMRVQPALVNSVVISTPSTVAGSGSMVTFAAIPTNGGPFPTYQWFINSVPVPGATNSTFTTTALTNGQTVHCKVASSLICIDPPISLSNGIKMTITGGAAGVANAEGGNALIISPNPTQGTFTISGNGNFAAAETVQISVLNMLGQKIYTGNSQCTNHTLNATVTLPQNVTPGMYLVNVTSADQNVVFHVSVEK